MSQRRSFYRLGPQGLSLFVRVTPNAGRDAIEGVQLRDDGTAVLQLRVAAIADRGKANAAVLVLLAKALGVPKSRLAIASGETGRNKMIHVEGDGAAIVSRLDALGW